MWRLDTAHCFENTASISGVIGEGPLSLIVPGTTGPDLILFKNNKVSVQDYFSEEELAAEIVGK